VVVDAVMLEPVSSAHSLLTGKRTGNFHQIALVVVSPVHKSATSLAFCGQIPGGDIREFSRTEQGSRKQEQRIYMRELATHLLALINRSVLPACNQK
jgi:hypothetical protein